MESEFRLVSSLSTTSGIQTIVQEGRFFGLDLASELEHLDGLQHKAFHTFLHHRNIADVASLLDHADNLNRRSWRKRKDMPRKAPDLSKQARDDLSKAVSAYYWEKQGRGEQCQTDYLLRAGRLHYFFVYPLDYAGTFIGLSDDGKFVRRPQKPAFEIVFVYCEQDGTLDLYAQGDKSLVHDLQEIFSRAILHEDLGPENRNSHPYDLNGLKNRTFRFLILQDGSHLSVVRETGCCSQNGRPDDQEIQR